MRVVVDGEEVYAYSASRPFDATLPTAVLIHGAANDHSVWALQSRYIGHHGSNVLAVDLPGHGRSGGRALTSVEAIARWIVTLLDALHLARAVLIGHSLGALAALHVAGHQPDRVSSLALLGPAVPMPVSDVLLDAASVDEAVAHAMITAWSFSPTHQFGGNRQPGVWMTGNALRLMQRCSPGVLRTDLVACNAYVDGIVAARQIRCPTLLVLGARDLMAPPRSAQALIDALQSPQVVTIPECGHSLMAEAPDAVLDALKRVV